MFKNKNKGFSLVELLVVISIVSILAGIAIANFSYMKRTASNIAAQSDYANLKKITYALSSDANNIPFFFMFSKNGPRRLPYPLNNVGLSDGVRLSYFTWLPLGFGRGAISFSLYHKNGTNRYRYYEFNGKSVDQVIRIH